MCETIKGRVVESKTAQGWVIANPAYLSAATVQAITVAILNSGADRGALTVGSVAYRWFRY